MHKMMNVKNLGLCLRPEVQKAPDQCGESNSCRNSKYYHHLPWDYQRVECVQAHTAFAYLTKCWERQPLPFLGAIVRELLSQAPQTMAGHLKPRCFFVFVLVFFWRHDKMIQQDTVLSSEVLFISTSPLTPKNLRGGEWNSNLTLYF